jgi:hypothetical protein
MLYHRYEEPRPRTQFVRIKRQMSTTGNKERKKGIEDWYAVKSILLLARSNKNRKTTME